MHFLFNRNVYASFIDLYHTIAVLLFEQVMRYHPFIAMVITKGFRANNVKEAPIHVPTGSFVFAWNEVMRSSSNTTLFVTVPIMGLVFDWHVRNDVWPQGMSVFETFW